VSRGEELLTIPAAARDGDIRGVTPRTGRELLSRGSSEDVEKRFRSTGEFSAKGSRREGRGFQSEGPISSYQDSLFPKLLKRSHRNPSRVTGVRRGILAHRYRREGRGSRDRRQKESESPLSIRPSVQRRREGQVNSTRIGLSRKGESERGRSSRDSKKNVAG